MRYYFVFLFAFLTHTVEAQVMLPAYQGVQYKGGIAGCGTLTINHLAANGVAPVDKTVTYGTVTGIPGEPAKCWITSNLGASQQATAVNDATEASAGWYWQFSRKQGIKHDGAIVTPTWPGTFSPSTSWSAAEDPCALELGAGWRIPTKTEWENVDASGGWANRNDPWNSGLKLHAAGRLSSSGSLAYRGGDPYYYWSSVIFGKGTGWSMFANSFYSEITFSSTSEGLPVRCIKD